MLVKLNHGQIPGLSRTKLIFQDFSGPGNFRRKIQDFPGGMGTLAKVNPSGHCIQAPDGFQNVLEVRSD